MESIHNIKTNYIGKKILHLDTVDSTNSELRRQLSIAQEGFTIIADKQQNGRGRLGRSWFSEDNGAIYMSILLKPEMSADKVTQITLLCGLAVCNAINKATNIGAKIKWPNDVVVQNKKICGILCEGVFDGTNTNNIIAGIGINVQNSNFPDDIKDKATSIFTVTNKLFDKGYIVLNVLEELERLYEKYKTSNLFFLKDYKKNCISLNRNISFIKDGKNISAFAYDIDDNGAIKARDMDGKVYTVNSGEITVQGIY